MDEPSKSFLRSMAAVVFLAILGVVLARPVFQSDEAREESGSRGSVTEEATSHPPEPTEKPEGKGDKKRARSSGVVYGSYPAECLDPAEPPPGNGAIAVVTYDGEGPHRVTIGTPAGGVGATFVGSPPIQWSPSGRWIASRGLQLNDAQGRGHRPFRLRGQEPWSWSPIADCLVVGTRDRLLVVQPPGKKTVLAEGSIDAFGFSPDGRHLFTSSGAIDLRDDPVRPTDRKQPESVSTCADVPGVRSESCAPGGSLIAAVRARRLVLTDGSGSAPRPLTGDSGWLDDYPEWGPRGSGVLFVRTPRDGGIPEVWFIPEGGNPAPTGLRLADCGCRGDAWLSFLDWSASPPNGSMPPVPGR